MNSNSLLVPHKMHQLSLCKEYWLPFEKGRHLCRWISFSVTSCSLALEHSCVTSVLALPLTMQSLIPDPTNAGKTLASWHTVTAWFISIKGDGVNTQVTGGQGRRRNCSRAFPQKSIFFSPWLSSLSCCSVATFFLTVKLTR